MPANEITKIEPDDDSMLEEWVYAIDDDALGIDVVRLESDGPWQWQVIVAALEFVREDPLESELRGAIEERLETVAGVDEVASEDREVYIIDGEPSGRDLTTAAAAVVTEFAERIRAHIDALDVS
jgi:hypothetical protein